MSATAKKIEVKIDVCGKEVRAGTIYASARKCSERRIRAFTFWRAGTRYSCFCKKQSLDLFAISKKKCEEDCDKLNEILPQAISLANKSKLDKKSIQIMESRFL